MLRVDGVLEHARDGDVRLVQDRAPADEVERDVDGGRDGEPEPEDHGRADERPAVHRAQRRESREAQLGREHEREREAHRQARQRRQPEQQSRNPRRPPGERAQHGRRQQQHGRHVGEVPGRAADGDEPEAGPEREDGGQRQPVAHPERQAEPSEDEVDEADGEAAVERAVRLGRELAPEHGHEGERQDRRHRRVGDVPASVAGRDQLVEPGRCLVEPVAAVEEGIGETVEVVEGLWLGVGGQEEHGRPEDAHEDEPPQLRAALRALDQERAVRPAQVGAHASARSVPRFLDRRPVCHLPSTAAADRSQSVATGVPLRCACEGRRIRP